MDTERNTHDSNVIDLAPVSHACRELVDWYDEQLAADQPTVEGLQTAMTKLLDLPPIPGRLGRDIDLVVSGKTDRSRDEVVGAIERLRHVANHKPALAPSPVVTPRRGRRSRQRKSPKTKGQPSFPGFDDSERRS